MLTVLSTAAVDAVRSGILLKHDFMGRIYHKLLLSTTGHYYATYYTSIPAAWLLSGLLLREPNPAWKLGDLASYDDFHLIDPACGSGTLLSAAYSAIKDGYIKNATGKLDVDLLHEILLSRTIYGYDVLDFAAHLTGHVRACFYGGRQLLIIDPAYRRRLLAAQPGTYHVFRDRAAEARIKTFVDREAVDEDPFQVDTWRTYLPIDLGGRAGNRGGCISTLDRLLPLLARYLEDRIRNA